MDRVDDLPQEAKVPNVIEIDIAIFPVCMVGLAGDLPMMQLQDIAKDIAETFENIDGVSGVDILGDRENEIWVELNPRQLSAHGISIAEVAQAVAGRSRTVPAAAWSRPPPEVVLEQGPLGIRPDTRRWKNPGP